MRFAAAAFGVTLLEFPAKNKAEVEAELKARNESTDPVIEAITRVVEPVATWPDVTAVISEFVVAHTLAYHGAGGKSVVILTIDPFSVGKQAARLADKIIH